VLSVALSYMYIGLYVKYRLFLSDFNGTTDFSINTQMSNYMKISPVVTELFHANGRIGGRTDRQT